MLAEQNPDYFVDENPYTFTPLAGVAFEWWTMQDNILVDNVYVGASEADAAAFAKATFDVKRPIEAAAEKASKPTTDDADSAFGDLDTSDFSVPQFLADPVNYSRSKVVTFVKIASKDPIAAFKTQPQTGAVVGGFTATLIGMIGILLGLLAPKPATVKAQSKKAKEVTAKKAAELKATAVATANDVGKAAENKQAEIKQRSTAAAPRD